MNDVPDPIRVFLVDDHDVVRAGVRSYLDEGIEVVGEASEVDPAIELILEREPDVVLLDIHLPGGGGRRVAEAVLRVNPDVKFLALTVSEDPADVIAVIRAGARGYLTKDVIGHDLAGKIRTVADGGAVVSPQLAAFAVEAFDAVEGGTLDPARDVLTERERQVAVLTAKGYTNRQISHELEISVKTTEKHMSAILRKLRLTNRSQVTRWVLEHPIVDDAR
jgi:DNA-binding NarL/FixJ family response regulator